MLLDWCIPQLTPSKEKIMGRSAVYIALLILIVGVSLCSFAMARSSGGDYSTLPRVVATVIAVEPRGMATIRTSDGITYNVIKGTMWRGGDTVECEHVTRVRPP